MAAARVQDDDRDDKNDEGRGAGEQYDEKKVRLVGGLLLEVSELLLQFFGEVLEVVIMLLFHTGLDAVVRADADRRARQLQKWPKLTGYWNPKRLSRIMGVHVKGVGRMKRRLTGNGMRVVAASAVLAIGAMMAAGPMATVATAQANPIPHAHIYPDVAMAKTDIQAALLKARREHKRVILDFGGDWCPDCQVLNIYFHQSPNKELLEKNYVLVDVNIGH